MENIFLKNVDNLDEIIPQKYRKINNFCKKIIYNIKNIFNVITVEIIDNKALVILPFKTKTNKRKTKKMIKKINYKFNNTTNKFNAVLSKELYKNEEFKNTLIEENITILDGKWLYRYLIIDILNYIAEKKNTSLPNLEVTILLNNAQDIDLYNVNILANNIRKLKIVTNNIEKFKNIENKLYDEKGIAIEISNNKKKSLQKSNIIINMDFKEELINKYNINRSAIIINLNEKINIKSKLFSGININNYLIELNENYKKNIEKYKQFQNFNINTIYEGYIYRKDSINNIMKKIELDKIKIKALIGNNGIINEKEFL